MSEDLIRRSDAIKATLTSDVNDVRLDDVIAVTDAVADAIEAIPTIDAVPKEDYEALQDAFNRTYNALKAIEPKRGEWKIEVAETIYGKAYLLTCSECGETVSVTETALPYEHFCRNCGADMREREGE